MRDEKIVRESNDRDTIGAGAFRVLGSRRGVVWTATLVLLWLLAPIAHAAEVLVLRVDTVIHPVAAEFIAESIAEANAVDAAALVIELSTPGGLLNSTRRISTSILESKVPVVVYVSPSGAHAASAGFFILMSGDVAAMAPGTNTGAAHPVGGEGEDIEGHMGDKVEEDSAANIRSLALRNGRNVELAESAVLESRSFTADEALEQGLIDLVAPSLDRLLQELDGWEVKRPGEDAIVLSTAEASVRRLEMSPVQRLLAVVAHPNVAYILLSLGMIGIYFEFANPGVILPGVVGAICLILGFYALSVLPLNFAGVALILLAILLFVAEVKVTSMGILTLGGVVSLVFGSLMLFKSPDPAMRVSFSVIAGVTTAIVCTALFLMTLVIRTHRSRVTTGREGLVGKIGRVRTHLNPRGKVFVHGELWDAIVGELEPGVGHDPSGIDSGAEIEVVAVDGLTLRVRPVNPS
ncbi:MAG: nodulation protein NfeD [Thermoanaerobaculia bacterium]|nr:nodulation protein NfeD [Thermoanaerobaculia bacterium]